MSGKSFYFFCTPEEWSGTLRNVLHDASGVSLFTEGSRGEPPLSRIALEEAIRIRPTPVWATVDEDKPGSFLGLIRLWPPHYKGEMLCMAFIDIKTEGEKEKFKATLKLYERLKKTFQRRLKSGLWGVNTKYGGEHFYRDFYISEGAILEFQAGRELAPQFGDGFVRFECREGGTAAGNERMR